MIVDTHCHAGLTNYEPVESLLDQMERHGIAAAVLVQHGGEFDNRYLSDCCRRYPDRFVAVGLTNPADPTAPDHMAEWATWPGLRGVRFMPGDPAVLWQAASDLGLIVSLFGTAPRLADPDLRRLLTRYDRVTVCLEHLGKPDPDEPAPYPIYRQALALAELPNVYLKVSGFYSFTHQRYPYTDVQPFADLALAAFGPRRMMWASDFPPVSGREGYHNALAFPNLLFPGLAPDERAWLMGRTAQSVWGIPGA